MFTKARINGEAQAFLNDLFQFAVSQNKRITASGDPEAAQDHFTMMTLHAKLSAVPRNQGRWQDYSENVLNTAEAFRLHLKAGGYYGAPIVGAAMREIRILLEDHSPQQRHQRSANRFFCDFRNG